jgi:hypothetical protein
MKTGLLDRVFMRLVTGKWYPHMTSDDKKEWLEEFTYSRKSATRVSWYWQSISPKTSKIFEEEAKSIRAPILYLYGKQSDFIEMVNENMKFFEKGINPGARGDW